MINDKDKRYLITGGSGFLGKALVEKLVELGYKDILVLSKNEEQLLALKDEFKQVEVMVGDIGNMATCIKACQGVTGIFHLAAFKHVTLAEDNVEECINSNIKGSINLLTCTLKYKPNFIIGISTDKAAKPTGIYGMTKYLMERLFAEYEKINTTTNYRTVRFGNMIYSTGSVLCKWKERILNDLPIKVTDLNSTRFYWTVDEAVNLIFECLNLAKDSKAYVGQMKAIKLGDLVNAMYEKYGVGKEVKIKFIGLQPGENLHEAISDDLLNSNHAEKYTNKEILKII